MKKLVTVVALAACLSGCGAAGRLKAVGKAPKLSPTGETYATTEIEPSLGDPAAARRAAEGTQPAENQPQ